MFLTVFAFLSGAKPLASYRNEPQSSAQGPASVTPKTSPDEAEAISILYGTEAPLFV